MLLLLSLHLFVALNNYHHQFAPMQDAEILQQLQTAPFRKDLNMLKTLSEDVMVVHPQPNAVTYSTTNASNFCLSAVLKEGCTFHINLHHKPQTFLVQSSAEKCSLQQALQLAFISKFNTDIHHIEDKLTGLQILHCTISMPWGWRTHHPIWKPWP